MASVAIIGGSGFYELPQLKKYTQDSINTPYGNDVIVRSGYLGRRKIYFLPRHGEKHTIPPHKINYRANIEALACCGVTNIIAINAVGAIHSGMPPGTVVIPSQVIDYTWGRAHTFYDEFCGDMMHVDFTNPFDDHYRVPLLKNLSGSMPVVNGATYACVQGPRLESAAEIQKYKRDGCDLVGMTLMPEAALAREKGIAYISVCLVCNWAAGIVDNAFVDDGDTESSMAPLNIEDIKAVLAEGLTKVQKGLVDTLTLS